MFLALWVVLFVFFHINIYNRPEDMEEQDGYSWREWVQQVENDMQKQIAAGIPMDDRYVYCCEYDV